MKTAVDNRCSWVIGHHVCGKQFETARELYNHCCVDHVGFKKNGTLTSCCKWDNCNFTVKKRDHLTSHLKSRSFYSYRYRF